MKKTKEEPSVVGLLLLVTGMLLLSVALLDLSGSGPISGENATFLIAVSGGAVACLGVGGLLSARKKKQPRPAHKS